MNFLAYAALSVLVFAAVAGARVAVDRVDRPQEHFDAVAEVDKYRMFVFVADQYVQQAPAVSAATSVSWDTMRVSAAAPPAVANVAMPSTWRIVRFADGTYVACTDMQERSVTAIAQLVPGVTESTGSTTATVPQLQAVKLNGSALPTHVVLGNAAEATTLATACN
ncbi:MAG: hypothetical protein AB7L71_02550 [Vicinamibacterales bacterium]